MTLRTDLPTSKRLKESGIQIEGYEKAWSGYSFPPELISHAFGWDKDIPAYSLDELLGHPRAREREIGIDISWAKYKGQHYRKCETLPDIQSALNFVATLLIEK